MEKQELDYLFNAVEDVTGVTKAAILSGKRNRDINEAKSTMMYIMRKDTTLQDIAKMLNLKNHATVSIKCTQYPDWLEFRKDIKVLYAQINSRYKYYLDINPKPGRVTDIELLIKLQQEHHEIIMNRLNKLKNKL